MAQALGGCKVGDILQLSVHQNRRFLEFLRTTVGGISVFFFQQIVTFFQPKHLEFFWEF